MENLAGGDLQKAIRDVDGLDLDMSDIVPDLEAALMEAAKAGAEDAGAVVGIDFKTPPAGALSYVEQRGAELVGMRKLPDGSLVPNPNPALAINETIRSSIKVQVRTAIDKGWSPQKLKAALEDLFNPARAETIARTETGFAYNEATGRTYEEIGVEFVEVVDGKGCLPEGHNDKAPLPSGEVGVVQLRHQANGQVWPVSEVRKRKLGHPRCVRAFVPHQPRREQ